MQPTGIRAGRLPASSLVSAGERLFHTYQLPFRNSDNRVDSYFLFAGENTELVSVANRGEVARENKRSREIAEPREEEEDQVK